MTTALIPKCANCVFGHVFPQDMSKRLCKGTPPVPLLMPIQGGVQMQFHWPVLSAQENGCALHKMKSTIDMPEGNA